MPNVARYDDFDSAIEENTVVEFRALHDIPGETQITQSYFPLSWLVATHSVPTKISHFWSVLTQLLALDKTYHAKLHGLHTVDCKPCWPIES